MMWHDTIFMIMIRRATVLRHEESRKYPPKTTSINACQRIFHNF